MVTKTDLVRVVLFLFLLSSVNVSAQIRTEPTRVNTLPRTEGPATFTRTLSRGTISDPEVKLLQEQLKALGYYSFDVNGIFGPLTESALRAFQRASGIPETGIFNLETKNALLQANKKGKATPLLIRKRKSTTESNLPIVESGPCRLYVNTLPKVSASHNIKRGNILLTPASWFSVRLNENSSSCSDVSITGVSVVVKKPTNAPKLKNIKVYRAVSQVGISEPSGFVSTEGNIVTQVPFSDRVELNSDTLGDNIETFHIYAEIPSTALSGTHYEIVVSGIDAVSESGKAVLITNESFRIAPSSQRKIIID